MSFFVNAGTISGEYKSTNGDTSTMISFFSVDVDTMIVNKLTLTKSDTSISFFVDVITMISGENKSTTSYSGMASVSASQALARWCP